MIVEVAGEWCNQPCLPSTDGRRIAQPACWHWSHPRVFQILRPPVPVAFLLLA